MGITGANTELVGHIAVTTTMAAAFATISATVMSWILQKKPDLSMIINGTLAGLVAITAGCAFVSVPSSIVIGTVAGVLVVLAVRFFDALKLDDPVGALSVHLVNGVFGTLAIGLFGDPSLAGNAGGLFVTGSVESLGVQALGVLAVGAFVFAASFIVWLALKAIMGIRVSKEEEIAGLDIGEHGMEAYPDFQGFVTK
jgi:Amt family ammonium transporter